MNDAAGTSFSRVSSFHDMLLFFCCENDGGVKTSQLLFPAATPLHLDPTVFVDVHGL